MAPDFQHHSGAFKAHFTLGCERLTANPKPSCIFKFIQKINKCKRLVRDVAVSHTASSALSWVVLFYLASDGVLVRVYIPAQSIMTKKQVGEERVYFAYTSILLFITKEVRIGTQTGQEAGADAEALEGCSLLACFSWLAQHALL